MRTVRKFSTPLADCQSATQQAASLRYPRPRLPPTVSTGRAVVSNSEIGMRGLQVVAAGILPLLRSSESIAPPGLVLAAHPLTAHAVGYFSKRRSRLLAVFPGSIFMYKKSINPC